MTINPTIPAVSEGPPDQELETRLLKISTVITEAMEAEDSFEELNKTLKLAGIGSNPKCLVSIGYHKLQNGTRRGLVAQNLSEPVPNLLNCTTTLDREPRKFPIRPVADDNIRNVNPTASVIIQTDEGLIVFDDVRKTSEGNNIDLFTKGVSFIFEHPQKADILEQHNKRWLAAQYDLPTPSLEWDNPSAPDNRTSELIFTEINHREPAIQVAGASYSIGQNPSPQIRIGESWSQDTPVFEANRKNSKARVDLNRWIEIPLESVDLSEDAELMPSILARIQEKMDAEI